MFIMLKSSGKHMALGMEEVNLRSVSLSGGNPGRASYNYRRRPCLACEAKRVIPIIEPHFYADAVLGDRSGALAACTTAIGAYLGRRPVSSLPHANLVDRLPGSARTAISRRPLDHQRYQLAQTWMSRV
jgi:hypothetical protein